ncbi:hypothetical protein LCGC14_3035590, partial [marine sediment metagenome]
PVEEGVAGRFALGAGKLGLSVLEEERKRIQPITKPALRCAGEQITETVAGIPGGRALRAAGVPVPEAPGREQAGTVTAAVGGELALFSNLIPIPIIDSRVARILPRAWQFGKHITKGEARQAINLFRTQVVGQTDPATKAAFEEAAGAFERAIAEPGVPAASVPAEQLATVPEALAARAVEPGAAVPGRALEPEVLPVGAADTQRQIRLQQLDDEIACRCPRDHGEN